MHPKIKKMLHRLKKIGIYTLVALGIFGVVGTGYFIIRDTGKMPPRPDLQLAGLLDGLHLQQDLSVVVTRFGREVYAYHQGEGVDKHTLYEIGDLAELFTAMTVMVFHDRGMLRLDGELGQYLADADPQLQRIPLHALLTHTSGLGATPTLDARAEPEPLPPGEAARYARANYRLLNRVLSEVGGATVDALIKREILDPLGMDHTVFQPTPEATGVFEGVWISCADDLLKWETALYTNQITRMRTLLRSFKRAKLNDGTLTIFGYGWSIENVRGLRMEQAGLGAGKANASLTRFSEKNFAVAILSRLPRKSLDAHELARTIGIIYLDREMPVPAYQN